MNSLSTGRVAETLQRLFKEAEAADRPLMESLMSAPDHGQLLDKLIEAEREDLRGQYRAYAGNYLNVSAQFGQFLYQCARARKATLIVEFGTSMGISTIHLAAALKD